MDLKKNPLFVKNNNTEAELSQADRTKIYSFNHSPAQDVIRNIKTMKGYFSPKQNTLIKTMIKTVIISDYFHFTKVTNVNGIICINKYRAKPQYVQQLHAH